MPYEFSYQKPNDECFKCHLAKERCIGTNRNGDRCKRFTCIGTAYCWTHLEKIKHLKIRKSSIPNSGKGLFAWDTKQPDDAIIFRVGDTIIEYKGERVSDTVLNERYGKNTAPYAVQATKSSFIDGACNRGVATLSNNSHGTQLYNNATLRPSGNGGVNIKCIRNIRNKTEILTAYGNAYRFNEPVSFNTKYVR